MNTSRYLLRGLPLLAFLIAALFGSNLYGQNCFQVAGQSVTCGTGGDAIGYTYTANIRNMGEINFAYADFRSITENINISPSTKTINPSIATGDTLKNLSFIVSGSGATAGTTVKVLARFANGSSRTSLSCSDTLTFTLPSCATTCLTIINGKVECGKGGEVSFYTYTFDAINGGSLPIPGAQLYYYVISGGGVTVSPAYTELPTGYSAGDTATGISIMLGGAGALPGTKVKLIVRLCNDGICCDDTIEIVLPECGPASCFDLLRQDISCGEGENEYDYTIALKNTSDFTANTLILISPEGTFLTPQFAIGAIKPGQSVTRQATLSVPADYQGKEITVTAMFLGGKGDSCSSSFTVTVPECAPRKCFALTDTSLTCLPTTNGSQSYGLGFTLHNETSKSVRWINFSSQTPNIVAGKGWVDLGTAIPPGESMKVNGVAIGGPGVHAGATVKIGMSIAGSSPTELVCSDSFAVVLPECVPAFEGCFQVESKSLTCISSPTAPPAFAWSFTAKNTSNRALDSLRIASIQSSTGGAVLPSPKIFYFIPALEPGETGELTTVLTGAGAVDGATLTLYPEGMFRGENAVCRSPLELTLECKAEGEKECFSVADGSLTSHPGNPNRLDWTFTLTNKSESSIDGIMLSTLASNVTVDGGVIALEGPVMPGSSATITARLTGGIPGEQVGVLVAMTSGSSTNLICVDTVVTTIPEGTNSVNDGEAIAGVRLYGPFPNPANNVTTVRLDLEHPAHSVTVTVTDAAGREVLRPVEGVSMEAGEHLVSINTGDLPVGTCIITLRVDGGREALKLNIVR